MMHYLAYWLLLACGVVLVFYPIWARRSDPRPRIRLAFAVIGLLFMARATLGLGGLKMAATPGHTQQQLQLLQHLKAFTGGAIVGAVAILGVTGQLLPLSLLRRKPNDQNPKGNQPTQ